MRRPSHAALHVLLLWALASPASAQPAEADTAAARALFREGRTFAEARQWEDAADRFRRALALRPTPSIQYNLAAALVRTGRLVEATELARAVLREAPARDPARAPAEALVREIEPRLGSLTVRVQGADADVEVLLDGVTLSRARLGVGTPIDPGHHTVVARRGSAEVERAVDVAGGASAVVDFTAPPPLAATSLEPVGDPGSTAPIVPPPRTRAPAHPGARAPPPAPRGPSSRWGAVSSGLASSWTSSLPRAATTRSMRWTSFPSACTSQAPSWPRSERSDHEAARHPRRDPRAPRELLAHRRIERLARRRR